MTEYFAFMEVRYRRSSPVSEERWNQPITKAYLHQYTQSTRSKSWTAFEVSQDVLHLPLFHFPPGGATFLRSRAYVVCRSVFHNILLVLRL